MVRTRAGNTKKTTTINADAKDVGASTGGTNSRKLMVSDFKKQAEERMQKLKTAYMCSVEAIERQYETLMMKIGPVKDMLFTDFCNSEVSDGLLSDTLEVSSSFLDPAGTSRSAYPAFATSTVRKAKGSPSLAPPPPQRVTRQSRQRSGLSRSISDSNINISAMIEETEKKPRRTRSVSKSRPDATFLTSGFMTPHSAAPHFPSVVTPKADPSAALRRHPRKGEFALSLTGSPLMVASTAAEMNITLPVGNGEVYSILPTEQFNARDIIPALTSDTKRQILLLRKNLDRLLAK